MIFSRYTHTTRTHIVLTDIFHVYLGKPVAPLIITLCAKLSGARVQCIVIGPVCGFVAVFVGLLPRKLEIVCIDLHQTGFVGEGSDHLQLIKFWPFSAPGKGICGGAKFLAPPCYSQCAVFASL